MGSPSLSIDVRKVSVSLGGKQALRDISWRIEPGQHWAVVGPNGAGKSTLLRLLRGDVRPDQNPDGSTRGTCRWTIDGHEESSVLAVKPIARLASPDQHRLYARKGWKVTGLGLILSGLTDSLLPSPASEDDQKHAMDIAKKLGAAHLAHKPINAMSQGQLRLALLARCLASNPQLVLLDEPFDGLDTEARNTIHEAIEAFAENATIIAAAHRPEDMPRCVTDALRLDKGKAQRCGPAQSLPRPEPARATASTGPAPVAIFPRQESLTPALELRDVDVYVSRAKVLHALNWQLPPGQNWRIAGSNGSGKSTFLRLLAGLEHVALGGSLSWYGQEHPPLATRMRETGYLSDQLHAAYTYDVTGLELVLSGLDGTVGLWREYSRRERDEAMAWIAFLGLEDMARTPIGRLSSGTARRFFLARALVGPVRLLLLDEPCSGLDVPSRDAFLAALDGVLAAGIQCLYVSHHDGDVPARITHQLVFADGRIASSGEVTPAS